jgi:hypothetical protein
MLINYSSSEPSCPLATGLEFRRGVHDCFTVAADAFQAATGRDPMVNLRGSYSTLRGALRVLRDGGGAAAMITAAVAPTWRVGGLAVCLLPGGGGVPCVGVAHGPHFWRVVGPEADMLLNRGAVNPIQTWGP